MKRERPGQVATTRAFPADSVGEHGDRRRRHMQAYAFA